MKKVLSTVAALALVAGVASNALALDKPGRASESEATTAPRVPTPTAPGVALWSVAGQWVLAGALVNGGAGDGVVDGGVAGSGIVGGANVNNNDSTDAWYVYSFKILPVLQVNDKLSMKGELRFVDRVIFGGNAGKSASDRDADFKHVYMEWVTPYGKTRFGRTPAGAWGPKFMNNTGQGDRLMWWPNMLPENWGMLVFTQKITERDSATPGQSGGDDDGYYVDISYKADFGKTIAALWMTHRESNVDGGGDNPFTGQARLTGNYKFGDFGIEYELNQNFADSTKRDADGDPQDASGTGFMADISYTMNDWKFGGLFFIMTGDDDPDDGDDDAIFGANGVGIDYNPYQILTGDYMGLLNGDKSTGGANSALFVQGSAGVMSFGGYVGWNVSPKMSLNATLGYAAATDEPDGFDDDYGVEVGLTMGYKIMDNLSYNAHFSFLSTGDYWDEGGTEDTEDVYLLAHALSMKF
jgi:hypothetical protein